MIELIAKTCGMQRKRKKSDEVIYWIILQWWNNRGLGGENILECHSLKRRIE